MSHLSQVFKIVAVFAQSAGLAGFHVDESKPYAELWMGTHPKSPSLIPVSRETLASYLAKNQFLIGETVSHKFGAEDGNLPFLFKVLAIEKALSIQSHPDKATAEKLHAQQPDIYKDPNHKPEMALAITPFPRFAATYLTNVPELAALIPLAILKTFLGIVPTTDSDAPAAKQALRDVFSALIQRYEAGVVHSEEEGVRQLVLRLNTQFSNDIGTFCAFLLNYPHAYISGDIIECMANSDNVIRAGLTPKLRDIPNLVDTLTYTAGPASHHAVKPLPFSATSASLLYDPPISEFSVVSVALTAGRTETHRPIAGPSIAIVTSGKGSLLWAGGSLDIAQGEVIFVGADTKIDIVATGDEEGLNCYRAFVET
ncbi:RmlC-like cupin domain-containing protein [Lactifluus volemus]|nr:RmlC-like cupin domain-containing protein [Lactifluus volemus]